MSDTRERELARENYAAMCCWCDAPATAHVGTDDAHCAEHRTGPGAPCPVCAVPTTYTARVPLTAHEPWHRSYREATVTVEVWWAGTVNAYGRTIDRDTYVLTYPDGDAPRDATDAIYVWDDGSQVIALYVAGHSPDGAKVYLMPFPTNGAPRADNGRPADFSTWILGPRRAFHVKVNR